MPLYKATGNLVPHRGGCLLTFSSNATAFHDNLQFSWHLIPITDTKRQKWTSCRSSLWQRSAVKKNRQTMQQHTTYCD